MLPSSGNVSVPSASTVNFPERLGWSKMEAYRLVSVACDVRITELVDGNVGVHVMIPKALVGGPASRGP